MPLVDVFAKALLLLVLAPPDEEPPPAASPVLAFFGTPNARACISSASDRAFHLAAAAEEEDAPVGRYKKSVSCDVQAVRHRFFFSWRRALQVQTMLRPMHRKSHEFTPPPCSEKRAGRTAVAVGINVRCVSWVSKGSLCCRRAAAINIRGSSSLRSSSGV